LRQEEDHRQHQHQQQRGEGQAASISTAIDVMRGRGREVECEEVAEVVSSSKATRYCEQHRSKSGNEQHEENHSAWLNRNAPPFAATRSSQQRWVQLSRLLRLLQSEWRKKCAVVRVSINVCEVSL